MVTVADASANAARAGGAEPFVSVVVPVRDDPGIWDCVEHLERQDYPADSFEVIVVDNGSDPSLEPPTEHGLCSLTVIREPTRGSYAARNAGVRLARGQVVAFTDADCLPEPGWLSAGVAALRLGPRVGLVAGDVLTAPPAGRRARPVELVQMVHAFPQRRYAEDMHFGATANVITRKSVLDEVGSFADDLTSGGDKEWGQRVHAAGWRVVHSAEARVLHPPRATWRAYRQKLDRVYGGELAARRRRGNPPGDVGRLTVRSVVPPFRSVLRRRHDRLLASPRDFVAYAAGALLARWAGAWAGATARRADRRRRPT